ncbi:MAG TPA: hypothetical protein VEJ17_00425 [Candidatus Nitrosotalea sp.]|nr:hypothetical protein [Candidatus Nitrosotalea sp.]
MLAALFTMAIAVAVAAPANKKTLSFSEPTTVGSVTLKPGEYAVEWNGAGPDVQVSFSRGKNAIVTVPAKLEPERNPQDISYTYHADESGTHYLIEIRTKNSTLRFAPRDVASAE